MKAKLFTLVLILGSMFVLAQDKTTVTATSTDISDNLDLRAIATIFGEATNLEDFEKKLNNPKEQISNLDLNEDNYVDYLRVIESIEGNVHLVIVQAVLDKDVYQDVATIEIEKDANNNVQVQVVGDVYMYGENYIYEPVYVHTPIIYNTFWVNNYRPYYSSWYWGYYPSYFSFWNPFPIFRYRNHINVYIGGYGHFFNYVNYRRCHIAYNNYYSRRSVGYANRYPNRSFAHRNANVSNRYELDRTRNIRTASRREAGNTQPRIAGRTETAPRSTTAPRTASSPRSTTSPRATTPRTESSPRSTTSPRATTPRPESTPRSTSSPRASNPKTESTPRSTTAPRAASSPRSTSSPRTTAPRSSSSDGGRNAGSRGGRG